MSNQTFPSSCSGGKIKLWIIVVILIVGGILVWQYFKTAELETIEAPETEMAESSKEKQEPVKLTLEMLKNAEYYFALYEVKARLIAGQHEEEELVDKEDYRYIFSAGLVEDKVAFGDLNNDGKEDAAVIVFSAGGGSGVFYELAVMTNENGNPYHLTSKYLGDRVKINSITVKDGIITLEMVVHDLGDASCCPTLHKVSQYKLSGEELLEI